MANRYWIGGDGDWSNAANWGNVSGGVTTSNILEGLPSGSVLYNAGRIKQTFTSTSSYTITEVSIYLKITAGNSSGITATIADQNEATLSNTTVTSSPTTGTYGWHVMSLTTPVDITNNQQYSFILDMAGLFEIQGINMVGADSGFVGAQNLPLNGTDFPMRITGVTSVLTPSSTDDIIIDTNSGGPTITINTPTTVNSISIADGGASTNIVLNNTLTISTDLSMTLSPHTITGGGKLLFSGTGVITASPIVNIGADTEVLASSTITLASDVIFGKELLINGAITSGNFNIKASDMIINTGINIGTSNITAINSLSINTQALFETAKFYIQGDLYTESELLGSVYIDNNNTSIRTGPAYASINLLDIRNGAICTISTSYTYMEVTDLIVHNSTLRSDNAITFSHNNTYDINSSTFENINWVLPVNARNNCIDGGGNSNITFPIKSKTNII